MSAEERLEQAREHLHQLMQSWDHLDKAPGERETSESQSPQTVPYKGAGWPVSEPWAEKHLAGDFAELVTWPTGSQNDSASPTGLWGRLWAILRKSNETLSERTASMTHADIKAAMEDQERAKAIIETLTPEELRELRAVEAHIIVRNRVDHLLGRDLAEFDIQFIDHAHGQGAVPACGCELLAVLDDHKLARIHAETDPEMAKELAQTLKFLHPHFPRKLCGRHDHLHAVVAGGGRWHNMSLAERLAHVHETIFGDQEEAQPEAAAA